MAETPQPKASAPVKYKIKSGAKSIMYPGLAEYTQDALDGEHGAMIVKAMKKTDTKKKEWNGNFDKLIEEVK